jgi:hypothetical protein
MSVAVVCSDRNYPDTRLQVRVKLCALVPRPVVGDLHHVDRRQHPLRPKRLLGVFAEVTEKYGADASSVESHRHAPVVPHLHQRGPAHRPVDVPAKIAEGASVAARGLPNGGATAGQAGMERFILGVLWFTHQGHIDAPDDRVDAADVVEVIVRQQEQTDAVDTEGVETGPKRHRVGPDIHQCEAADAERVYVAHHNGVTLPDVAGCDLPIAREGEGATDSGANQHPSVESEADDQQGESGRSPRSPG